MVSGKNLFSLILSITHSGATFLVSKSAVPLTPETLHTFTAGTPMTIHLSNSYPEAYKSSSSPVFTFSAWSEPTSEGAFLSQFICFPNLCRRNPRPGSIQDCFRSMESLATHPTHLYAPAAALHLYHFLHGARVR
jgi:hypothetical protein